MTPVANAGVTLRPLDRDEVRKTVTSEDGRYAFAELLANSYELTVEKAGSQKLTERVELAADQRLELDITLKSVTVQTPEAARKALGRRLLRRETSAATDSIQRSELLALPLSDDPLRIISQTAGLSLLPTEDGATTVNVGGARSENSNLYFDGFVSVSPRNTGEFIRPTLEALQTVKIKADASSAQFAKRAGLMATVVTKRGGDDFHGSLFGYLRNTGLNARSFFDADRPNNHRTQFGGVVGAPVWIPGVYDGRHRTFFFVSAEGFRESLAITKISGVPTALEHQGDFSQSAGAGGAPVVLMDPFNPGATFPDNQIPASEFSPEAKPIDTYFTPSNLPGSFNNYRVATSGVQRWSNLLMKLDHRISDKDELSYRIQVLDTTQDMPYGGSDLGTFGHVTKANSLLSGLIWYHEFSQHLFNEARASIQRATGGDSLDPNLPGFSSASMLPAYTFTGLASIGYSTSAPTSYAATYLEFADNFTLVRAREVLKWGFEYMPGELNQLSTKNSRGTVNFQDRTWTSKAYADFLMGLMRSSVITEQDSPNYARYAVYGLFVQDAVKLHPRWTLNLGLRYEQPATLTEKNGNWSNFLPDMGTQVTVREVNSSTPTAAALGLPDSLVFPNRKGLTPRVGVAWRPLGGDSMRVSASWGMFVSTAAPNSVRQDLAEVLPFLTIWKSTRSSSNPDSLTLENPFPVGGLDKPSIAGYDLHPPLPYLQSWNFSVQNNLGKGRTLELQYLGSKGTHLARRYDLNQAIKDPSLIPPGSTSLPKPYPSYKTINYYSYGSNSSYNALLAAFTRRLTAGSTLRVNYTYSKSIDDASNSVPSQGFSGAQDTRYLWLERGLSDFDQRNALKLTFDLQSPWKKNLWLRGWAFSGIGTIASGLPSTPQVQNPDTGKGEASRPDRIASGHLESPGPNMWFDLAAFPPVPTGSYRNGTSGRNILPGPGVVSLDLSLRREFRIDEARSFELRADGYNALNHANFGQPATYVNAPNAGTIVTAKPGRVVQMSAKFAF